MKNVFTLVAAAGIASVLALPASAETASRQDGLRNAAPQVEHSDVSAQRRYYHRRYGYRQRYWGPRYGYYRPYGYYGYRPYYGPGVSLGFYPGPRFGVWF